MNWRLKAILQQAIDAAFRDYAPEDLAIRNSLLVLRKRGVTNTVTR